MNRCGQVERLLLRRVYILVLVTFCLQACEFTRERGESILLIAVEGLSFNALNCDVEDVNSPNMMALKVFCEESVRFSHAFTPSTMSQAALASVLTGFYPFDHLVRTNGGEFLSTRFTTLAELALNRRYQTLFVSGGAPIWRKSGLAQGYEIFDDSLDLSETVPYRPAAEVVRLGTSWLEQARDGRPFFATLFFADLQFPRITTVTNSGELRQKGLASQVEEVLESLGDLIQYLKNKKRWDRTNVAIFGLNSLDHSIASEEPVPLNLKSDATQVEMWIKPARKEGGSHQTWAIDRNVSLVDLSYTIFEWLGETPPETTIAELRPRSLQSSLSQAEPDLGEDRLILTESAWADWLEGAGLRWAVRKKQFLYIHDKNPIIYNTLTDRLENLPLKVSDPLWVSVNSDVMALLKRLEARPFRGLSQFWYDQLSVARELWLDGQLKRRVKGNEPWVKWYLQDMLTKQNWKEVKRISQELSDPVGIFVASRHLGEFRSVPRNPCVRLVLASKENLRSNQADCEDEKMLALYAWRSSTNEEERAAAQERFVRLFSIGLFDQELGRMNYLGDLNWDVDREWPYAPSSVEFLLTLKEFEPFTKKLATSRANVDGRF